MSALSALDQAAVELSNQCHDTGSIGRDNIRRRLRRLERALRSAGQQLGSNGHDVAQRAAEWLLDNAYLTSRAIRRVRDGLPRSFYRQLPIIEGAPFSGMPRIYAVARRIWEHSDDGIDLNLASHFIHVFQQRLPLTIGELWAFPNMIRLVVLEELSDLTTSVAQTVDNAPPDHMADGERQIAGCINSIRLCDTHDWKTFFESVSVVDQVLRSDPAQVYARMEFETRDQYRKVVEQLGHDTGQPEVVIAHKVLKLSSQPDRDSVGKHIGYYLVDDGIRATEIACGFSPSIVRRTARWALKHATWLYFGAIAGVVAMLTASLVSVAVSWGLGSWAVLLLAGLALLPASTVAVSILNWLVTQLRKPRVLPRLDFQDGIDPEYHTLVVVPCLLTNHEEVAELLHNLEVNYNRNPDATLRFALLSDYTDAQTQSTATDDPLLRQATQGIDHLNSKYGTNNTYQPFLLLHRQRVWNEAEGVWMGWERKRGKLAQLNQLILRGSDTDIDICVGAIADIRCTRYVITLDADTVLPRETAARLIGTMAHPLNSARFDPSGTMIAGYTVLQPRIDITPVSVGRSWFATIFSGDTGLDLYTHATSDVYQDLFGSAIYAGKGVYDVAAFELSLHGCVPPNALLSHDLFEGVHGRAGFVSDLALFEEFPSHVLAYARRMHRWIRGDWQILPWLCRRVPDAYGGKIANRLTAIDRWKIFDNLRRSLQALALIVLAVFGWLWLPVSPLIWTGVVLGVLAIPVGLSAASAATRIGVGVPWAPTLQGAAASIETQFLRWLMAVIFLPYSAGIAIDAVTRTVYRLTVSQRRLLEWTSAASTARRLSATPVATFWREMIAAPSIAVVIAIAVGVIRPDAMPVVLPIILAWFVSPLVAWGLSRTIQNQRRALGSEHQQMLRRIARRTWHYFEFVIGPNDHWLPPDNIQLTPEHVLARRTSPTNLGMGLIAPLAAFDLGYVGPLVVAATLRNVVESMGQLERYRGHFLNWYETANRAAMTPKFVSTVDSGNLAASLITLSKGLKALRQTPIHRAASQDGLLDTLAVFEETLDNHPTPQSRSWVELKRHLLWLRKQTELGVVDLQDPISWRALLTVLDAEWLPQFETLVTTLLESESSETTGEMIGDVHAWSGRVRYTIQSQIREIDSFAPWLALLGNPPQLYTRQSHANGIRDRFHKLRDTLTNRMTLDQLVAASIKVASAELRSLQEHVATCDETPAMVSEATSWNQRLHEAILQAKQNAARVVDDLSFVSTFADNAVAQMDFRFLFDDTMKLFFIGFNVSSGEHDHSHYDLLASEARLASLIAIGKGDVPTQHWLQLGRPFGRVYGKRAMLSWSGTMFEFLMPALFTINPTNSLTTWSSERAVRAQMKFARRLRVPWGVSESGYARQDANGTYQYRAFGVPYLALNVDAGDRVVIAPYASVLALALAPREVVANIMSLSELGTAGHYGLYEALDFGPRDRLHNRSGAVVRSYMTHHQGMILVSLDNYLNDNPMIKRFHASPMVAGTEFLMYEQIPRHIPVEQRWVTQAPSFPRPTPDSALHAWPVETATTIPQVHVLSNERYNVLITAKGGGGSQWRNIQLTRWRSEPSVDSWGHWVYVRDRDSENLWSVGLEPSRHPPETYEVQFTAYSAEFFRRDQGIATRMVVAVPAWDDVEVRRITVINETDTRRRLAVTSYAEVVLSDAQEDLRHPAFAKLFIETQYDTVDDVLLFQRRARSPHERPVVLGHAATVHPSSPGRPSYETDRLRFVGRGGSHANPAALDEDNGLSQLAGCTLDPVMALNVELDLAPGAHAVVTFVTAVGSTNTEVVTRIRRHRDPVRLDWTLERAQGRATTELLSFGLVADDARHMQTILSCLVFPFHPLRASGGLLTQQHKNQSGLWGYGISGDYPLLLVRVGQTEDLSLVRKLIDFVGYWRAHNVRVDLVILDEKSTGYSPSRRGHLERLIVAREDSWHEGRDSLHLLSAEQVDPLDRNLLEASARLVLETDSGPLEAQLDRLYEPRDVLPAFVSVLGLEPQDTPTVPIARATGLLFDNGYGGFTPDGREYVIALAPGVVTPAPWINVIANPDFGFTVSEAGSGSTYSLNSAENRLTPWANDPVLDRPGEVLYLRDEETAQVWTPTPNPMGRTWAFQIRHGAGWTTLAHNSHGLEHELLVLAAMDAPVKLVQLTLTNQHKRQRRLTATYYAEWVLGTDRTKTTTHIVTEYDDTTQALLACNPFHNTYGHRIGFLAASDPTHGFTTDRDEFLGPERDPSRPAGLFRIGLSGLVGECTDPCAALQVHVDLAPGETRRLHFVLGQASNRQDAIALARLYQTSSAVNQALSEVVVFWDEVLGQVVVSAPDPAMNVMLNRWLLYQTIACRLWARTALYQSSGAFGFRDQLQDVMTVIGARPALARHHILRAARHQFIDGDVLHWWHPQSEQGVRTRCSDDLAWLPFVTAHYVSATNDHAILDEPVPYLTGASLQSNEIERFGRFEQTDLKESLFEHCRRAIDKAVTTGSHGLPLIGSCDWNDGFSRVGVAGRGESVWLAWFLCATLDAFAELCDSAQANRYRATATRIAGAVESHGWDGDWYRRAFYDDGSPLGSASSDEAQIDSIAQSWAVLSKRGKDSRAKRAVYSAVDRLVDVDANIVRLLTPPFDDGKSDPGYIKAYPPGVRENGGQYSHAATWLVWALAALGDGDKAHDLFRMLNPIEHADTTSKVSSYRVEPYVVAADIYSGELYQGRGGWTWYTGAAGWLYRVGIEGMLGCRLVKNELHIDPCISRHWPGFSITWQVGKTRYNIRVENPHRVNRGVEELRCDDELLSGNLKLVDDGEVHTVVVRLGQVVHAGDRT